MYEDYNQKNELVKEEQTNWENLSDNKCPLCSLEIIKTIKNGFEYYICTCGFQITEDKFNKIIQEMQNKRLNAKERKLLQEGKKVKFKETKTFKGVRPEKIDLGF